MVASQVRLVEPLHHLLYGVQRLLSLATPMGRRDSTLGPESSTLGLSQGGGGGSSGGAAAALARHMRDLRERMLKCAHVAAHPSHSTNQNCPS